ncbi:hypothetical protein NGC32_08470 [Kluyvera cryocrescens]|uniref:hypothetical protein n=1 Tax=Kluyvera cryocrescens TaxID=580 RepID=UPI002DBBD6A3|nr:hypothetical protein [Kluyvera cryocrescens]MEB7712762.1 hypothetical protein [Kluyvera cryocrescens]
MSSDPYLIYILCKSSKSLNKIASKIKKRALKKGGMNLLQSQVYTVAEYKNETAIVNQNAVCTCLYLLGEIDAKNFIATLLKDLKPRNIDDTIYYCLRFLSVEDAIRLTQYNDITFATMKEL